jgi:formylglycine-generating enzyme required for sulfatase activity
MIPLQGLLANIFTAIALIRFWQKPLPMLWWVTLVLFIAELGCMSGLKQSLRMNGMRHKTTLSFGLVGNVLQLVLIGIGVYSMIGWAHSPQHSAASVEASNTRTSATQSLVVEGEPRKPAEPRLEGDLLNRILTASYEKPFINSLGMRLVDAGTPGVLFCVWKTRVRDFQEFVRETGHDATKANAYGFDAQTMGSSGEMASNGGSWIALGFPVRTTVDHPVVCVSYYDAEAFCEWLTTRERARGLVSRSAEYRLPTDDEWSKACGTTQYPWGDAWPPRNTDGNFAGPEAMVDGWANAKSELAEFGFSDDAPRTSPVGGFKPNRYGLFDMAGNAFEWSRTWYTKNLNDEATFRVLPTFADDDGGRSYKTLRGSDWRTHVEGQVCLRSTFRLFAEPEERTSTIGFRVVLSVGIGRSN